LILFPARDYFAERWDGGMLLSSDRHPTVRTLIATHELVPMYEISGRELPDGTIELYRVSLDFEGLTDPEVDF
jgi:hypothetical protein